MLQVLLNKKLVFIVCLLGILSAHKDLSTAAVTCYNELENHLASSILVTHSDRRGTEVPFYCD